MAATINEVMNENWLSIPGFPIYEVNRKLEVRNKNSGNLLTPNTRGEVRLRRSDGRNYGARNYRLLYAALHGISPDSIRKVVFYDEGTGKVSLISNEELLSKMRNNRTCIVERLKNPNVCCTYYKEAQNTIEIILDAYRTSDFSHIASEIYQCEKLLVKYILTNFKVTSPDIAKEAFYSIAEKLLICIKDKMVTVYNIKSYLCRMAKAYFNERHQINSKVLCYNEAILKHNIFDF